MGIYLDESVISLSLFTPDIDLFDMSRVEVLRGPQGTLFGSGSLAGTVRYITNQPEIGVSEGFGEFSLNSIGDGGMGGNAKVAVNVPMGDSSAMRITAYHTAFGGFMDAVQPDLSVDEDVNSGERTGARWALRFEPSENVTVTPRVIYQELSMDGWNRIDDFNILANPYTTTRPAVNLGERELFTQFEEPTTDEFLLADLKIEIDLDDGYSFTSITTMTDRDVLVVRDSTALYASVAGATIGLPEPIYNLNAPLIDATTATGLTQELRLSSGDEYTHWVLGLFYSSSERDYGQSLPVTGFEAMSGIPTAGAFGADTDELFYSDLNYEFDQTAAFFEITWTASERVDLTAGARWYDYEENRSQVFDGLFADPGPTEGETSADGIAPRFIASYEVSENTRLNAQVSKGFRLGGINDPLNVPVCTPEDLATFSGRDSWNDEELWNYEVGSKSTILGRPGHVQHRRLHHGHLGPADDCHRGFLLLAADLQRAERAQHGIGTRDHRAAHRGVRLRDLGQLRGLRTRLDPDLDRRRRRDQRGLRHRGRATACRRCRSSRPRSPRPTAGRPAAGPATSPASSSTSVPASPRSATMPPVSAPWIFWLSPPPTRSAVR